MPGGGQPARVEVPGQRVGGAVEREQPAQHRRGVGRLVDDVVDVESGRPVGGVRVERRGDHEPGPCPAGQHRGVVVGLRLQAVTEHHEREGPGGRRGPVRAGIPDPGRQRPVRAPVEGEVPAAGGERPARRGSGDRDEGRAGPRDQRGRLGGRHDAGGRGGCVPARAEGAGGRSGRVPAHAEGAGGRGQAEQQGPPPHRPGRRCRGGHAHDCRGRSLAAHVRRLCAGCEPGPARLVRSARERKG
jgi:hypothetical protein